MDEKLTFGSRLKHAWDIFRSGSVNAASPFRNSHWDGYRTYNVGLGSTVRQDRVRLTPSTEKSIVASLYNKISVDVAAIPIKHIKTDKNGRYKETLKTGLNECLTVQANIDQTGRELIQDVVLSAFDEGYVAIVPVETDISLTNNGSFDILSLRTGKILEWYPRDVRISVYDDRDGDRKEIVLPKEKVAIIQNPFYSVMNERNSTLKRLIRKLNLLDLLDESNNSSRFNMILQLPYTIKSEARKKQAADRLTELENQLSGSTYGIAYVDGTEKITQLNRTIESDLVQQVENLTNQLYSQIGITKTVFDGTADEKTMLNYQNSTLEPVLSTICDEMTRKYLTKTARTQGQKVKFFRDPFRLVPIDNIADMADKFTRNEIVSSNEFRTVLGLEPVDDARADELRNKNLNQSNEDIAPVTVAEDEEALSEDLDQEAQLDEFDAELDALEEEFLHSEMAHYASPYYDPVKAHEYYERTKKLKGRRSTSGLNEEGKKAASYIKTQLDEERKAKVQTHKDQTNASVKSNTEKASEDIKAYNKQMKSSIAALRNKLKAMSELDRSTNSAAITRQIEALRERNEAQRESIKAKKTSDNSKLRTDHKTYVSDLKEQYDTKYEQELSKLGQEKSFKKTKKR